jgi:hypothetical protein
VSTNVLKAQTNRQNAKVILFAFFILSRSCFFSVARVLQVCKLAPLRTLEEKPLWEPGAAMV